MQINQFNDDFKNHFLPSWLIILISFPPEPAASQVKSSAVGDIWISVASLCSLVLCFFISRTNFVPLLPPFVLFFFVFFWSRPWISSALRIQLCWPSVSFPSKVYVWSPRAALNQYTAQLTPKISPPLSLFGGKLGKSRFDVQILRSEKPPYNRIGSSVFVREV